MGLGFLLGGNDPFLGFFPIKFLEGNEFLEAKFNYLVDIFIVIGERFIESEGRGQVRMVAKEEEKGGIASRVLTESVAGIGNVWHIGCPSFRVILNAFLECSLECSVAALNKTLTLRMVGRGDMMFNVVKFGEFRNNGVDKVSSSICLNMERITKDGKDRVVED